MRLTLILGLLLLSLALIGCDQPLSHFKCYTAIGEPIDLEERLRLEDQFHIEKDVEVIGAKYFCNPVKKYRAAETVPHEAELDENHLTCYLIRDEQRFWADVDTRNQFGEERLRIRDDQLLCVPTYKSENIQPIPPGTSNCPGGLNCCCDSQQNGSVWPACNDGLICRNNMNDPDPTWFSVCVADGTSLLAPLSIDPSEPPFCRM